ncbi:hypothetical protein ACTQ6A_15595 [Lachnospiraceae bacterium LCP25S3_G4]
MFRVWYYFNENGVMTQDQKNGEVDLGILI